MEIEIVKKRIKVLLLVFIVALTISGLTAFPIESGLGFLNSNFGPGTFLENSWPAMSQWINHVHTGVVITYQAYPFIAYSTDWLAFAHIVIAIAFIGPLRDPVKNIWVVEFGLIACILVIPTALICGPIRGIPFFWILIDCSFGVIGFVPLWITRKYILRLARLQSSNGQ